MVHVRVPAVPRLELILLACLPQAAALLVRLLMAKPKLALVLLDLVWLE